MRKFTKMHVLSTLFCKDKNLTKQRSRDTVYPKGIISAKERNERKE